MRLHQHRSAKTRHLLLLLSFTLYTFLCVKRHWRERCLRVKREREPILAQRGAVLFVEKPMRGPHRADGSNEPGG